MTDEEQAAVFLYERSNLAPRVIGELLGLSRVEAFTFITRARARRDALPVSKVPYSLRSLPPIGAPTPTAPAADWRRWSVGR